MNAAFAKIKPNSRVTIKNRFGQERTGRAVMFNRDTQSWVLNMGGQYGTPAIADETNVVRVGNKRA
jgi:hypothetical protein